MHTRKIIEMVLLENINLTGKMFIIKEVFKNNLRIDVRQILKIKKKKSYLFISLPPRHIS